MRLVFEPNDVPSMTIKGMPVWEGMQQNPGVKKQQDFVVHAPQAGPIVQSLSSDLNQSIVDKYNRDDYNFITKLCYKIVIVPIILIHDRLV